MQTLTTDLLIIGGGINGAGIAADAAGRHLSVILCEQDDLAAATSSWSTKLIHGGLRYLENFEFKLVHEALHEREILLKKAPHLIHPLEFILPYQTHLRPVWMIHLGLFLYDHLAKRYAIPRSSKVNLTATPYGEPLKRKFKIGFSYYDCQTDDARLVILNALAAKQLGATILTRTICKRVKRENHVWKAELINRNTQENIFVTAKAVVNATGPWVAETLEKIIGIASPLKVTLVKGSHIVIPKLYSGHHAYILQNQDKRIVFTIPYQQQFTLIGTTDINFSGSPHEAKISDEEIEYLCTIINDYFEKQISKSDIIWSYSGVRSLHDGEHKNPAKISRDYYLAIHDQDGAAPLLSIFGGKITTFRILAEQALEKLRPYFSTMGSPWTAHTPLPGGDLQQKEFAQFTADLMKTFPWLDQQILTRYANSYGTLTHQLLKQATSVNDLGQHFGAGFYESELRYLIEQEWAQTLDDIIWRRTKLGLLLTPAQQQTIAAALTLLNK